MANKHLENQLKQILEKYISGKASKEEIDFLHLYYEEFANLSDFLANKTDEEKSVLRSEMELNIMERVIADAGKKKGRWLLMPAKNWYRVAAAASVILIVSFAFYFTISDVSDKGEKNAVLHPSQKDLVPGGNRALLTLANGSTIILDSASNGTLSKQGNVKVIKLNDGQLVYDKTNEKKDEILYNTISTPKGGQYQLVLSDGSRVWLNAASSLRFPATFSTDKRKVELTGEGYFEVAKNKAKPFEVVTGNAVVEVLGTHFNINAYNDEAEVRTTLLEGSVNVRGENSGATIVPGEQAVLTNTSNKVGVKKNVDVEEVTAWKNGLFQFKQADVQTIMRQIARWYNVDVVYENGIPNKKFDGKIHRNANASEIFKILEEGGIHFKIDGGKLIVSPS